MGRDQRDCDLSGGRALRLRYDRRARSAPHEDLRGGRLTRKAPTALVELTSGQAKARVPALDEKQFTMPGSK